MSMTKAYYWKQKRRTPTIRTCWESECGGRVVRHASLRHALARADILEGAVRPVLSKRRGVKRHGAWAAVSPDI